MIYKKRSEGRLQLYTKYREDPLYSCNLAQLATLQASKGDLDCRRRKIMCQSASGSNYFPIQDTISRILCYTYEVPLKNNIFSLTVFQYD